MVAALIDSFFRGYRDVARGSDEAFVPLDEGLAVISRHASDLGYDALVLFLDELILWLATHAADLSFLNEEGPKVSKLVEAEAAGRPIPIVSFVARQRDLRELVGEQVTGALQLGFADVLQWWEARFERITLEDRNLPEIAARRLLRPRDQAAGRQIDSAYAETEKVRREVFETLLTPRADRAMFRKVYPFSPALVETLVAVSSLLQRERTALKVMLQILVDGRETLDLGEIVPVGDLFDAIAEGDEPFTEGTRHHFENARNLYRRKLLPLIERRHGISKEDAETRPKSDREARALRAEDRLAKTLLLSALAPEVEVLKNLTAARLAALNHGSIRTPIEGREGQEVLRRCRAWAAEIGEVRIGDDPANPTIAVQLSAVDTESILADAGRHDNTGNRRRLIRDVLFSELGIEDRDELMLYHDVTWRGTQRRFEVIFANVRELPDESLSTRGDERKVIVDFPFDEPGHTWTDDRARLEDFRGRDARARTLVWLPSFLSASAQRELGTLVRIDHVLRGDRLRDFATHLSPVDQASARELLRNQRSQLRQRLVHYLEGAYGVENPSPGSVVEPHPPAAAPPVLFHKGDLREAGAAGVPRGVAESIADPGHRVVGVVINAVDDHLAKGEQVPVSWTARQIRPVQELLEACRSSGRVVVLASDHGHVLERETELRDVDGAERWRPAAGAPADDEVLLQGPRVVTEDRCLLAPWSERVRFGMKKNGYHGGATLQEVVLPFGVFALPETAAQVAGWREAAQEAPGWWQWRAETGPASESGPAVPDADRQTSAPVRRTPRPGETGDLFAQVGIEEPRPAETWIDRLMETDLFAAQRKQAARTALPEARIRAVLAALDARGGRLTGPALAERLGVPQFRLGGIVSALRRILNVEGYDVLSVDDASETIQLNRELLDTQFGLVSDRK